MRKLQQFRHHRIAQIGHAGEITARSIQACDQSGFDRIGSGLKDDRYRRGGGLSRQIRGEIVACGNNGYLTANEILGQFGQSIVVIFGPAIFDHYIAAGIVASFAQALLERAGAVYFSVR